jgi:protein SCO1/2
MTSIRRLAIALCLASVALTATAASATENSAADGGISAPAEMPRDSVYLFDARLEDQDAAKLTFRDLGGQPRIVAMFYANCPYICPLIIDTIQRTEKALDDGERARLKVALITLDPERDDPAALADVVAKRKLDVPRWRLVRSGPDDVRRLAAVLGIQYRQLENRDFNHSSALILLSADGRVLARTSRIGELDPEFLAAVKNSLQ